MKTRKFLLAATAAMTALLFGLTSCEKDGLTVDPNYVSVNVGETFTVTAKSGGTALDASSVTWTSNNPDYFSIENGVITGLAVGQGTFTATYNDQSVTGDVIVSEALPEAPIVKPVANGITLVVHIPTGTDCNGAPLWAGDNTNYESGLQMTAIEDADGWYKIDFADLESMKGKVLAAFKGWESNFGWDSQWLVSNENTIIMEETTATAEFVDDQGQQALSVSSTGLVYLNIKQWQTNPCGLSYEGEFTITVNLPECTPADAQIHFVGSPAALGWEDGQIVEIVTDETGAKTATLVVSGKNTDNFKVKLDGAGDWSRQGVYCNNGAVSAYENEPLGSTEEEVYTKTFTVEGWGDNGKAIEGCLTDCVAAGAE